MRIRIIFYYLLAIDVYVCVYTYTHRAREEELAAVDVHLSMLHALMQVRILTV